MFFKCAALMWTLVAPKSNLASVSTHTCMTICISSVHSKCQNSHERTSGKGGTDNKFSVTH